MALVNETQVHEAGLVRGSEDGPIFSAGAFEEGSCFSIFRHKLLEG